EHIQDTQGFLKDIKSGRISQESAKDLPPSLTQPDASNVFETVIGSIREAAETGKFASPPDARQVQQVEGILKAHQEYWAGARDSKAAYELAEILDRPGDKHVLAKLLDRPDNKQWKRPGTTHLKRHILKDAYEETARNRERAYNCIDMLL